MRNGYLSRKTAQAIDEQVAKVFKGLGNPQPPIRLEEVQELLKLDRQFYTATDTGILQEAYSRIKIGTTQIFKRPELLIEAIKKFDLKALYVPDKRRILIDSELPKAKIRWATAHEITHELCNEWHETVLFGDSDTTISEACHQQIEREANYGAGRLLTFQDRFVEEVAGKLLSLKEIGALAKVFANTWSSTLWRTVESLDTSAFALISHHPHHRCEGDCIRHFVRSRKFELEFADISEEDLLMVMRGYSSWNRTGPLGNSDEIVLKNVRGEEYLFYMETFANKYDTLTLGQLLKRKPSLVAIGM